MTPEPTTSIDVAFMRDDPPGYLAFKADVNGSLNEIARLFIKNGQLHYEGKMPPTETARMFIDEVNRLLS
jgi:hypothetical protein